MKKATELSERSEGSRTRSAARKPKGAESSDAATPTTSSGAATETSTNTWDSGTVTTVTGTGTGTEASGTRTTGTQNTNASRGETVIENPNRDRAEKTASTEQRNRKSHNGSRSSRSARLRAELEARIKFEKLELEKAQAAAALARTEMELARLNCEEDSSCDEEELRNPPVEPFVQSWVQQSIMNAPAGFNRDSADKQAQPQQNPEPEAGDRRDGNDAPEMQSHRKSDITVLTDAIVSAIKVAGKEKAAPQYLHELPSFDGDPSEWIVFKTVFQDTREYFTGVQNVGRLRKALKGNARESVRSLLFVMSEPGEIMNALERRFGRAEALILAEIENVKRLPRLAEDGRNIGVLASRVNNTVASIHALNQPQYLYSPELVSRIIEKLSTIIKFKWFEYRSINPHEPELQKLSTFLNNMSEQFGASLTSESTHEKRKRPEMHDRYKRTVHTAQQCTSTNESSDSEYSDRVVNRKEKRRKPVMTTNNKTTKNVDRKCILCNEQHRLSICERFKKLNVKDRWEKVKHARLCFQCLTPYHTKATCKAKKCGVEGCVLDHHRLLHLYPQKKPSEMEGGQSRDAQITTVHTANKLSRAYLKIIPVELHGPKGKVAATALLDEGSTMTLIEENVARQIAPRGPREGLSVEGIGGKKIDDRGSYRIKLKIKGMFARELEDLTAQTIRSLNLSPQTVSKDLLKICPHLSEIQDELMYDRCKPTILIGQDNWHLIVTRELKVGKKQLPVASLTKLGWVLHGQLTGKNRPVKIVNHITERREDDIEKLIKEHFSLESLGISARKQSNDPEERALAVLEKTVRRIPGNRYESGLLWKSDSETMPDNRIQAERRLYNIEKKLDKNPLMKIEYEKQIDNLIESGYAEKVCEKPTSPRTWYLPHFAVTHPQKGKIRLVFDAAARTSGRCLNDALLPGPDLLQSLFGVLLRFREGHVAVMADIKEMFLQVKIREEDRDSLRFLWRKNRISPPEEYRMTSLIFGAASSPCTAIYVKNKNAQENAHLYPEAAAATERNFYMDDYLQAFPDIATAERMIGEMDQLHKLASFQLRGWASNCSEVLRNVDDKFKSESASLGDREMAERTLGLIWNINRDTLSFSINLRNTPIEALEGLRSPTKREITSAVMSIFDPLGLASPITVQGKALIQLVWRAGIDWDEQIPQDLEKQWCTWLTEIKKLGNLEIARPVIKGSHKGELHTFTDASEKAYAAAVYYVAISESGERRSMLLAAKAKVAPLKPISIPRLELQAALLGSRLATSVGRETNYPIENKFFWTDSRTVLSWIHSDPRTFKAFVAHRLAEIEEHSKPNEWRWVPTSENVADDATRNAPVTFDGSHRWFRGPQFIRRGSEHWPVTREIAKGICTGEEKIPKSVNTIRESDQNVLPDHKRFSSYVRLLRATARTLQAIDKFKACRKRCDISVKGPESTLSVKGPEITLENNYITRAQELLIKRVQSDSFYNEMKCLKANKGVDRNSRLNRIAIELSNEGLIRLNGRLPFRNNLPLEFRKPIVLDGKHYITRLIIYEAHCHYGHANHSTVINEINQKFYVINLRNTVRHIVHSCQWCRTYRSKPQKVPQGNLPVERIAHHEPPFSCAGVDYFGPMSVTVGRRHEKRWGVLFTCMTTRAIHMEIAASLTPSSMIMALRRFIARRGKPSVIYSDNGTNFKAANKELQQACEQCCSEMKREAERKYVTWKFIPPGAPHMGGAWERLIRSVKVALTATMKERNPREEVLHTFLLEAEHTVNSRPLVSVNMDSPEEGLTPNHFLIGRSCGDRPPGVFTEHCMTGQPNWKMAQLLADYFWKRWLKEYLPTLIPRTNSDGRFVEPKVGDIVLIVDHSLPRNTWPRGKIHRTLPGKDGHTRIVDIVTNTGILRRPTSRLVILVSASPSN